MSTNDEGDPRLEPREGDDLLDADRLLRLPSLAVLGDNTKAKLRGRLEDYPGSIVLRRYAKRDVICEQGEPGWSAFIPLTITDLRAYRDTLVSPRGSEEDAKGPALAGVEAVITKWAASDEASTRWPSSDSRLALAEVHLAAPRPVTEPESWTRYIRRTLLGGQARTVQKDKESRPSWIPIDGPRDLDYESRLDALYEGELFGEMSCLDRAPRSATVVTLRDCYVLEMLHNIFELVRNDNAYAAKIDQEYRKRYLKLHLRENPLLNLLSDDKLDAIREKIELVDITPGELIYDEHDHCDCMHLIRGGTVKVMKGVSALLAATEILDGKAILAAILQGKAAGTGPGFAIWSSLSEESRKAIESSGGTGGSESLPDTELLADALNGVIKSEKSPIATFADGLDTAVSRERIEEFVGRLLPEGQARSAHGRTLASRLSNRQRLEHALPGLVGKFLERTDVPRVLAYRGSRESIGEMGLLKRQPRSATCVAFSHPPDDSKRKTSSVRLVRISKEVFESLEQESSFRETVATITRKRHDSTAERLETPLTSEPRLAFDSPFAEELGLYQGQALMLIDLDRCTRCDECVRACVRSHDDGRSRLYLDGPRYGSFLVPATCRSCLDPVCMIGCPVTSIRRGDSGEISILDFCIGCKKCAEQCPYGSIQMHDIGIIPERADGWKFRNAADIVDGEWFGPKYQDDAWHVGCTPFNLDRDLREILGDDVRPSGAPASRALCFRFRFDVPGRTLAKGSRFRLIVESRDETADVWVNGHPILEPPPDPAAGTSGKPALAVAGHDHLERWPRIERKRAKDGKCTLKAAFEVTWLRDRANVLALRVAAATAPGNPVLSVRLDEAAPETDPFGRVTERTAVNCDLCHSLAGGPACVSACPHEAALRIHAPTGTNYRRGPR